MPYAGLPCGRAVARAFVAALALLPISTPAHIVWTRVNSVDSDTLGLYHFSDTNTTFGAQLAAAPGLPTGRNLIISNTAGGGMQPSVDVPETIPPTTENIFGPGSLELTSVQTASSAETLTTATVPQLLGDVTVEFWMKWPTGSGASTSSSLQVGFAMGLKLQVARDSANPTNDQFGVATVHGGYAAVPGFTNWVAVGDEEAPLDDWLHVAMCVHSTGVHSDPSDPEHYMFDAGSVARFYLNGHRAGTNNSNPSDADVKLDIANSTPVRTRDFSTLRIGLVGGTDVLLDEVTIWKKDWSANGTNPSPFHDGRGAAPSGAADWMLFP